MAGAVQVAKNGQVMLACTGILLARYDLTRPAATGVAETMRTASTEIRSTAPRVQSARYFAARHSRWGGGGGAAAVGILDQLAHDWDLGHDRLHAVTAYSSRCAAWASAVPHGLINGVGQGSGAGWR